MFLYRILLNVTNFRILCANVSALSSMVSAADDGTLIQMKMASQQISSTQPRLHGACLLPGHILVSERFHGSAIVKALQGLQCCFVVI